MSTRQADVTPLPVLLVRSGHGSAAVAAVPGMPAPAPSRPALVPTEVAGVPVPPRPTAPPTIPAPSAIPGPPPVPVVPLPGHAPTPAAFLPPPRPAERPAAERLAIERPAIEPLFSWAPGLNWAGPGDQWSQAWETTAPGALPPASASVPPPERPAAAEPPTARDIELIRASLAAVEPVADRATAHFYALIFERHPELRALFPAAMDVQRDRLFRALLMSARSADDPAGLTAYLSRLGQGHRKYGTLSGHYPVVGECLIAALEKYCAGRWDAATELAWRRAYGLISKIMIDAAEGAARQSPPWWQAEVVSHQQRGRDVAVITVRPDQPYPYRAGQHTTLETPWWPRVWRHFSFATAPRPDGLLTFHVKALPAGWVSTALVRRAAPGDVLRLGQPDGAMVVDHADPAHLLCLGGGTGIAPICALVEEVAERGAAGRRVEVFYGARQAAELYELDHLRALEQLHPWLAVRPVVSEERGRPGSAPAGLLTDVVARLGPWDGHQAFLSGPAAMVRRGAGALLRSGVRPEHIRHDLVGDLA
ncbi:NAD(P)H-flavin reductase/hemoglobin-like flavoprotein [Kitasatospora sp. MAP12-15]|uniref:globin domain-containing protein n=1 Tax=unclassified Kitasatospora TaxID=2633591 RepID=UPI002476145F|nr:globin domain-containing protein [Kitasatospora sp. MAP12-44]MDH6112000.1 NAD(P)H-flavin reductase/hemoglobin-like flavoprotein [Kitasatospora sp. MAP12-44]